jgi:hypothetical protein
MKLLASIFKKNWFFMVKSSAQFPYRFCQAITEIPERGSLFQRPENGLQGGDAG